MEWTLHTEADDVQNHRKNKLVGRLVLSLLGWGHGYPNILG